MIKNTDMKKALERVNKLKQYVILNYCKELDFNDEYSIYTSVLEHFSNGELDLLLELDSFNDLSLNAKNDLIKLVSSYNSLCFCKGKFENWLYSVEGRVLDKSVVFMTIFDNYDFLVNLAKKGGKNVLELIESFDFSEIETSPIDYLRNTFGEDEDVLKNILLEMAKDNSKYNIFDTKEKSYLLSHPQGTLFEKENDEVRIVDPIDLNNNINERVITEYVDFYLENRKNNRILAINNMYEEYIAKVCAVRK